MKIAISNLAWDYSENNQLRNILRKYKIKGIEVAPTKIWQDPIHTQITALKRYKKYWLDSGVEIVATTSLLFGHPELTIFENKKARKATFGYLLKMIELSGTLGAKAMVFGSPKNRRRDSLDKKAAIEIAKEFFYKIGEFAKEYDIYFGIEPNPPLYGSDFILTTMEAIDFVKEVGHPHFSLHLDSSTMEINKEDYEESINLGLPYAHHFHISEPGLKPIPQGEVRHKKIAKLLKDNKYSKWVSVEMPLGTDIDHLATIEKTLQFVTKVYN